MWLHIRTRAQFAVAGTLLGLALLTAPAVQGKSPDAFERAVAATVGTARATTVRSAPPDAFVRGAESLRPGRVFLEAPAWQAEAVGEAERLPFTSRPATRGGFHWIDFGIGAGAGCVLVLLGLGGALGTRRVTSA